MAGLFSSPEKPKVTPAPTEDKMAQAQAEAKRKIKGQKGYSSTIFSDLAQQYGLKQKSGE